MIKEAISPYIRRAWDHSVSHSLVIRERDLWDYELMYIKEGELLVTVEQETYHGVSGDVFLFKPRQKHSIRSQGNTYVRQPHIHFDLIEDDFSAEIPISFKPEEEMDEPEKRWFREDLLSSGPMALPNHIQLRHPAVFEQMLFDLISEYRLKLPFFQLNVKGQCIKLITYLIRERHWTTAPQVQSNLPLLLNIQEYLSHHTDSDITLDELSSMFHLSKYYLARLFRHAFNTSPIQYHQMMRLEKAKQLIQFTDIPLKDISENLGFININVFSRAFKNKEGVPPSHYRRKHE
jgi:AraC-like DNA-binding protein